MEATVMDDAKLAEFVRENEGTIVNALQTHAKRMREAAEEFREFSSSKVFQEDAESAASVAQTLEELLES